MAADVWNFSPNFEVHVDCIAALLVNKNLRTLAVKVFLAFFLCSLNSDRIYSKDVIISIHQEDTEALAANNTLQTLCLNVTNFYFPVYEFWSLISPKTQEMWTIPVMESIAKALEGNCTLKHFSFTYVSAWHTLWTK